MVEVEVANKVDGVSTPTPASALTIMPDVVQERVEALRKLQIDYFRIQAEFHREVAELEHKYYAKYEPLITKRKEIVNGEVNTEAAEPSTEHAEQKDEGLQSNKPSDAAESKNVKGIPNFWLTCLKNVADDIQEVVIKEDEPILQHLTDINIEDDVDSFKLHFHFSANEFFTNEVLTKEFKLKLGPSDEEPLDFDGPEICAMKGTKIEWKSEEKNVTQRVTTNKQRNKKTGEFRTIVKTLQTDSFFNFFNHPDWVEERDDMNHELAANFQADIGLGSFIRERLIPRAVLYFTGEAADEFDGDEYDEDLDEEGDSEGDSEFDPAVDSVQKAIEQAGKMADCKQH